MPVKPYFSQSVLYLKKSVTNRVLPSLLRVEESLAHRALDVGVMGYAKLNQPAKKQLRSAWLMLPNTLRKPAVSMLKNGLILGRRGIKTGVVLPFNWVKNFVQARVIGLHNRFLPEVVKKPLETLAKKVHAFFMGLKPDVEAEKVALGALKAYLDSYQAYLQDASLSKPERTALVMLGKKVADYKQLCNLTFWGCLVPIPFTYLAEAGALMAPTAFLKSPLNNAFMLPLVAQTRKNFWGTVILGEVLEWVFPVVSIPFKIRLKHLAGSINQTIASQQLPLITPISVVQPNVLKIPNSIPSMGVAQAPCEAFLMPRWVRSNTNGNTKHPQLVMRWALTVPGSVPSTNKTIK